MRYNFEKMVEIQVKLRNKYEKRFVYCSKLLKDMKVWQNYLKCKQKGEDGIFRTFSRRIRQGSVIECFYPPK